MQKNKQSKKSRQQLPALIGGDGALAVSIVARRYDIQPNQLFAWRKFATQGALTATASQDEVVPASDTLRFRTKLKSCSAYSARR